MFIYYYNPMISSWRPSDIIVQRDSLGNFLELLIQENIYNNAQVPIPNI